MHDEHTIAALQRQAARDAMRRRRQQTQRDDLLEAARALLPDHGLALPYPQFAVEANVPRHAAAGLYNGTGDLAAAYVRREVYRLIERTAPAEGASPADFLAHLIEAMRAAPEPHRVLRAMECGLPPRLLAAARETDILLARAVGVGLREVWPEIPAHAAEDIGRRALALVRDAACQPHAPPARAEAALIVAMVAPAVAARAAEPAMDAAPAPDAPQPEEPLPAAIQAANDATIAPAPAAAVTPPANGPRNDPPDPAWATRQAVGAAPGWPPPPRPPDRPGPAGAWPWFRHAPWRPECHGLPAG